MATPDPAPLPGARLLALLFLLGFGAALAVYPLSGTWLLPILLAYALLLLWRPALWLLALTALLPIVDLAPRTGWFFLEEIDLLLLLTCAIAYWHLPRSDATATSWPLLFRCGLMLLTAAMVLGMWRGLQPWPAPDANTFNNYLSPANAARVGKGWLWLLLLLPPLRAAMGAHTQGMRWFLLPGMMLGLLLVSLAALRERVQFPGLLNFSSDYRISAPFSAMHTGGAALDGYLALATPLLAVWLFERQSRWRATAALALLPLALYVGSATFSRGLYLALGLAVAIICYATLRQRPIKILLAGLLILALLDLAFRWGGYRGYALALLIGAMVAISAGRKQLAPTLAGLLVLAAVVPVYHGYYVNARFSTLGSDWHERTRHWRQTLALMDGAVLGLGLGKFPSTYYWHNLQNETPPSYAFVDQGGNRYLRLMAGAYPAGYGELLRMLQAVDVAPGQHYQLGLDVANSGAPAFLHVNLCQRQLLYPQRCVGIPLRAIPAAGGWQRLSYSLVAPAADGRPVKLEIAVEGQNGALDIDNVNLRSFPEGHELLRNGSFSDANDYWFFSSDRHHLPWHVKNLGLNLYFEMGVLGLAGYALISLSALGVLLKRRDFASLAAFAAFQTVGLFDSLIDVPRITLLSTLLLCAATLQTKGSS